MRLELTGAERRRLVKFVRESEDRREHARGTAMLMRSRGRKTKDVARELDVCAGAVFKWERIYRREGVDGLRLRKPTGRPPVKGREAMKIIPGLMRTDPRSSGFPKGRWVVRDVSKALKEKGVDLSPTRVHAILTDLGLSRARQDPDLKSAGDLLTLEERGGPRDQGPHRQMAPAVLEEEESP